MGVAVAVSEIARLMNLAERAPRDGRKKPVWRYRNTVAILETLDIPVIGKPHHKKYVLERDLRNAARPFWDGLLDAEALNDDE